MAVQQVSRARIGARFFFNVAIAPLLLGAAFIGACWLLG